jgi:hypothetical protein
MHDSAAVLKVGDDRPSIIANHQRKTDVQSKLVLTNQDLRNHHLVIAIFNLRVWDNIQCPSDKRRDIYDRKGRCSYSNSQKAASFSVTFVGLKLLTKILTELDWKDR